MALGALPSRVDAPPADRPDSSRRLAALAHTENNAANGHAATAFPASSVLPPPALRCSKGEAGDPFESRRRLRRGQGRTAVRCDARRGGPLRRAPTFCLPGTGRLPSSPDHRYRARPLQGSGPCGARPQRCAPLQTVPGIAGRRRDHRPTRRGGFPCTVPTVPASAVRCSSTPTCPACGWRTATAACAAAPMAPPSSPGWGSPRAPPHRGHRGRAALVRLQPDAARASAAAAAPSLFFRSSRWLGELHIVRPNFRDDLDRQPQAHVYYDTHVDWYAVGDALPKKRHRPRSVGRRRQAVGHTARSGSNSTVCIAAARQPMPHTASGPCCSGSRPKACSMSVSLMAG